MKNGKKEPIWIEMFREQVLKPKQKQRFTERYGRTSASQKGFYSSAEWIVIRDRRRLENPLCQHCEAKGKLTPMTTVNHKIPVEERPDLALVYNNTESLCDRCNDKQTKADAKQKKQRKKIENGRKLMSDLENFSSVEGGG